MFEEALSFDNRLPAALAMLEGALGVTFSAREKARALHDAAAGRASLRRYRLYHSRRLQIVGRAEPGRPAMFWFRLDGRAPLERTCLEIVQRLADRQPAGGAGPALSGTRSTLMRYRELGRSGLTVSALGLGCMAMSEFYGPHDDEQSISTIRRALDLGLNFLDTADVYGRGQNEELVGRAIRGRRNRVILATKFGIVRNDDPQARGVEGRPQYVRKCCDASLQRLGVDVIDLYYQHRVDPQVPIEDTVGAMAELVQAGKVRYLGLSEAAPQTLRRAAAVHKIAALQSEYSLWTREPEQEVLPACRQLGIGFVAYSPLGRGFLAGQVRRIDDMAEDDWRRFNPRFQRENLARNLELVQRIERFAAGKGCTPAQLALAWLLARGDDIVPIPGTRRIARLEENIRALEVELSRDEVQELDELLPVGAAAGLRYPEPMMALVNR